MGELGYNSLVAIQTALAGNTADTIQHYNPTARMGEQLRDIRVLAPILGHPIGVVGFSIRPVGSFGEPEKPA